jgi:signal transduction histidine kinase/CheY-like chemotaxis protein
VLRDVVSSLRVRLLVLVLLTSLPSLAIIMHVGLEQRRMATRWAIDETQHRARDFAAEQDRLVGMTRHLLTALARLPEVRRLDGPACSALFADLLRRYRAYSNLIAIEPDGDVFCSAVPSPRPVNLADRPYFQRVLRTRDFVVGEYIIGRITGLPNMPLAYPALDESGRVVVVVFAALDLSWLNRVATGVRHPEGASVTITDREGVILVRHPDPGRWVGRPAPFFNNIRGASEGTFEAPGVDGVRRLYGFTTLGDPQRAGGAYVTVGFPVAQVYAAVNRITARNLALLGLAAVLALLLAWAAGDLLVLRRVRGLLGVIGRLKAGDLSARSGPVAGSGELGILAAAFDEMAEAVQLRIAERERAEEEVRRLNAELEHRVIERTAQLAERERDLRTAREEADRANQAKSEFLSRMSHELRTPLNAVLGFGQLLEMDDLTPTQREGVAQILKGGRHLLDLINEVLDIARIEAGRMSLSLEPVPVGAVIRESMDLVAPLASERHVHLLRAGTDDVSDLFVLADRQRLKQVLLNLLSNAVKFNRQEGTVSLSCQEAPGARVRIGVQDTGPGIPPERMERLFVPFERLGAEQAGVEGTGLGLALSRRLAEAMGGALGVESEAGVGSTFWVDLPSTESPRQRLERAGVALPAPADLDDSTRVRIVLYIEDNLSNVKLIQHLLAHRPEVRLIPAMQGRLGLELAREHRPHLVLLDLHLPDIHGEEVLRLLQESPKTQGIPVVVISADATPGQVGRLIEAGARDYLTKPLDVRRLMGVLDSILGQG